MERNEILTYLKYVVEIEKNIYSLTESAEKLQIRKQYLGIPQIIPEPIKPTEPTLQKTDGIFNLLVGIVFFVVSFILVIKDNFFTLILSMLAFLFGITFTIIFISELSNNRKKKYNNDKVLFEYEQNKKKYNEG